MPFDGASVLTSNQRTLASPCLTAASTRSSRWFWISTRLELARHPASWFYRHRVAVHITVLALMLAGVTGSFAVGLLQQPGIGVALGFTVLTLAMMQSGISVRGPALWTKRAITDVTPVHPVIRESALRLQEKLPGVKFKLGELIQDRVTLDPYLIAEYNGERAILGIWDGEKLIAGSDVPAVPRSVVAERA
jgi:hypothetical protein